jgi:type II secretory pathway component PulF
MPTYKYQSVLPAGVSVFGIFDAENENALAAYLLTRGMTLVACSEVAIDKRLGTPLAAIPRILQLRIGERIQEALLTGLPAHVAIAAMANEPFEHPLLMAMPWLSGLAGCAVIVSLLLSIAVPEFVVLLIPAAVFALLTCLGLWIAGYWWLQVRPRYMLLRLSRQMAAGSSEPLMQDAFVPMEIRSIMNSGMAAEQKSLSVAELLPSLGIMQVQRHLFATKMVAPFLALLLLIPAGYSVSLIVIPKFKEIFIGFGVELPGLTMLVIAISDFVSRLGVPGLFCVFFFTTAVAVTFYSMLIWSPAAEILSVVPMLGTSLRLLMQARVARVLGVLVKNNSSVGDAISVATDASGFREVRRRGKEMAQELQSGKPVNLVCGGLHGLPLSLLLRISDQGDSAHARQETAQSFMLFAASLEQASLGHGSIVAVVVEILAIMATAIVVSILVISLFMPLINLLNNLSVCVWTSGAWL